MRQATICIFAKPPRPGGAKTRLVPAIGKDQAARVAGALLADTIEAALGVEDASVVISATEPFESPCSSLPLWVQPEGDLGFRVEKTLQRGLAQSRLVLAVGADTPGLSPAMIRAALENLSELDAVLGPTVDGGYYLLGLRRCPNDLLRDIRWSHPETLRDTVVRLRRFGMTHRLGRPWFDLDTPDDLSHVLLLIRNGELCAPHLQSALDGTEGLRECRRA